MDKKEYLKKMLDGGVCTPAGRPCAGHDKAFQRLVNNLPDDGEWREVSPGHFRTQEVGVEARIWQTKNEFYPLKGEEFCLAGYFYQV